ncbi:MAG TPA: hypothetical protein VNX67_09195 [Solirubrobacteraceae bacterium]|nr:hypothetical protein [Solirubrobacteraceae bacterium]
MDITVYLPDDIGKRAKAADPELNLSRLLRDAVEEELARRERVAGMQEGAREYELDLETPDGNAYTGVLTGTLIAEDSRGVTLYLTTDERVMAYDHEGGTVVETEDAEVWRDSDLDTYLAVCDALGQKARVEV